jgi:hypothetical protein
MARRSTIGGILRWLREAERLREGLRGLGRKKTARWSFQHFYRARRGFGGHLIVGNGRDASGMNALVLGVNHFALCASRHGKISEVSWQSEDSRGHAYRQWGHGGHRQRVNPAGERKKKMSFSTVGPTWQPDIELVCRLGLGWAGLLGRFDGLRPCKLFLLFFLV